MTRPTACAWCGAALGSSIEARTGRLRCASCGVATTDPWPTDEELEAAYSGWYRPAAGRFSGPGDALLRRSRGALARRIARIAPPGRVLDVGTGDGALLDALKAAGREATGLERRSSRPDVLEAELADVDGRWAAIVFWHSLEHLRGAGEVLKRASELLAPEGVLVVALPNSDSLQARVLGSRWLALDLPRHLVHVPAPALRRRLEELGLGVERESHLRGGQAVFGWLHGLVGAVPGTADLYDAIRRPGAREKRAGGARRALTLATAGFLLVPAAALALGEAAAGRGGTLYVEARRGPR